MVVLVWVLVRVVVRVVGGGDWMVMTVVVMVMAVVVLVLVLMVVDGSSERVLFMVFKSLSAQVSASSTLLDASWQP